MNDREVETLNEIYTLVVGEGVPMQLLKMRIVAIIEDRLAECGLFPEGEDPNGS